jgi:hypothetical protein
LIWVAAIAAAVAGVAILTKGVYDLVTALEDYYDRKAMNEAMDEQLHERFGSMENLKKLHALAVQYRKENKLADDAAIPLAVRQNNYRKVYGDKARAMWEYEQNRNWSPSKVKEEWGAFARTPSSVAAGAPGRSGGSGSGSVYTDNKTITINVNGTGDPMQTANLIPSVLNFDVNNPGAYAPTGQ